MSELVISPRLLDLVRGAANARRRTPEPQVFTTSGRTLPVPYALASDAIVEDSMWARRGVAILACVEAGIEETVPWEQVKAELGL